VWSETSERYMAAGVIFADAELSNAVDWPADGKSGSRLVRLAVVTAVRALKLTNGDISSNDIQK
jgi:hypothetical protein